MKSPLQLTINRSIIVDQVAQFLIAIKKVPYNTEIKDIIFDNLRQDRVLLTVYFNTEELEVVHFDLDNHVPSKSS